jgi:hypothetical protein
MKVIYEETAPNKSLQLTVRFSDEHGSFWFTERQSANNVLRFVTRSSQIVAATELGR